MSARCRVTFTTSATITVELDAPDGMDEFEAEDWVADQAHEIASEDIETWGVGIHGRARLEMSLDGIGADDVIEVSA